MKRLLAFRPWMSGLAALILYLVITTIKDDWTGRIIGLLLALLLLSVLERIRKRNGP